MFKVGDRVRMKYHPGCPKLEGAIGTISQIDVYGKNTVECKDWSIASGSTTHWIVYVDSIELADSHLQQEEAKKLLGLK